MVLKHRQSAAIYRRTDISVGGAPREKYFTSRDGEIVQVQTCLSRLSLGCILTLGKGSWERFEDEK